MIAPRQKEGRNLNVKRREKSASFLSSLSFSFLFFFSFRTNVNYRQNVPYTYDILRRVGFVGIGEKKKKKRKRKTMMKKRSSSVSWVYSKTRHLPALKSHQPSRLPFSPLLPVISTPSRLSLLFYLFRLSTPFWKLAQISRQFTLCALRRFPPSRFHPEWRSHPNGSRYRFIRLRPPSHPYDVLMGLTPGPRYTCTYRNPATCVARSIVGPPPGC